MKGVKSMFRFAISTFLHCLKEFTENSTLHGVKYMSMKDLHLSERFLWIGVFMVSVYGASTLIANSLQHYNENPTVITIQKNFREWNVTFPAATFCFIDNMDAEKAKAFITDTWKVKAAPGDERLGMSEDDLVSEGEPSFEDAEDVDYSNVNDTQSANSTTTNQGQEDTLESEGSSKISKFRYYFMFLQSLVNQTYENMHLFKQYVKDHSLRSLDVEDSILKIIKDHTMKSIFYKRDFKNRDFYRTPTEMGMCYVHGSKLADYITLSSTDAPRIRENFELPTCNYMDTLCYARTEGTPSDIRYYVHSPYELPDISDPFFPVKGRMDRDVSFHSLETVVSEDIYNLKPSQRHCRFMLEPAQPHLTVYSFNLCRMQCRKKLAYKLCGCAPYFYTKEELQIDGIPVCGVKGLACISDYAEMLITLRTTSGKKLPCDCLPQCIDNRYTVDKEIVRQWMFPVPYDIRFRWAIEKISKIRLRRDVIYSFIDLVVSFGGTAAFFFGCSLLSFVEIIYFFTLRLFWFVMKSKRNKTTNKSINDELNVFFN